MNVVAVYMPWKSVGRTRGRVFFFPFFAAVKKNKKGSRKWERGEIEINFCRVEYNE